MVTVNCNAGVDAALKILKKRMQQELRFTKMKERRFFESPAEKAKRKNSEAIKRKIKFYRMMKAKERAARRSA